jgi:hypothetical protein
MISATAQPAAKAHTDPANGFKSCLCSRSVMILISSRLIQTKKRSLFLLGLVFIFVRKFRQVVSNAPVTIDTGQAGLESLRHHLLGGL